VPDGIHVHVTTEGLCSIQIPCAATAVELLSLLPQRDLREIDVMMGVNVSRALLTHWKKFLLPVAIVITPIVKKFSTFTEP
jgi:hypothetical protein